MVSAVSATVTHPASQHGLSGRMLYTVAMDIDPVSTNGLGPAVRPSVMTAAISNTTTQDGPPLATASWDGSTASSVDLLPASDPAPAAMEVPLRLGQHAHAPQRPHPTQDLLALYGLQQLVASVARTDPVTGEKNKMRKSYEGKVKMLGIAGRNKAVRHEPGVSGGLLELLSWPEEEWFNQKVAGKELAQGLPSGTLAKMTEAFHLEPGLVPRNDEWENLLGHEKLKPVVEPKAKGPPPPAARGPKPSHLSKGTGMTSNNNTNNNTASGADVVRPKRTGKKRRYDEHSFEGYGEGFVDDEADPGHPDGGYSSADGSRKSNVSKKRRRKDYNVMSPTIPDRGGSYGVGMMHMGTGIGAFSR